MRALNDRRVWLAGGAVAAGLLVLLSWLFLIGPQLGGASTALAATDDARRSNDALRSTISDLKKQNDNLSNLTGALAGALSELPTDTALPAFNRQVTQQAASSGVQVTSITVSDPTAGGGQVTTPAAGQVMQIPVTLVTGGPVDGQVAFLKSLQYGGPRRVLVTGVNVAVTAGNSTTMTLQATLFYIPTPASKQAEMQRLLAGDASR